MGLASEDRALHRRSSGGRGDDRRDVEADHRRRSASPRQEDRRRSSRRHSFDPSEDAGRHGGTLDRHHDRDPKDRCSRRRSLDSSVDTGRHGPSRDRHRRLSGWDQMPHDSDPDTGEKKRRRQGSLELEAPGERERSSGSDHYYGSVGDLRYQHHNTLKPGELECTCMSPERPGPDSPDRTTAIPATAAEEPSEYVVLQNLFDPSLKAKKDFYLDIRDGIHPECSDKGLVLQRIHVHTNTGSVYLKLDRIPSAKKAITLFHGHPRYGRMITATYITEKKFGSKFGF